MKRKYLYDQFIYYLVHLIPSKLKWMILIILSISLSGYLCYTIKFNISNVSEPTRVTKFPNTCNDN